MIQNKIHDQFNLCTNVSSFLFSHSLTLKRRVPNLKKKKKKKKQYIFFLNNMEAAK